jgi:hypothetical protein
MRLVSIEFGESVEDVARSEYLPIADAVSLIRAARDQRPVLQV